jgi:phosphoglycolate phosphatase
MKKTLLVDFDGTIIDSLPLVIECAREIASDVKISESAIREKELAQYLKKDLKMSIFQIISSVSRARKYIGDNIQSVKLIKGIAEILKELSNEHKIIILSSNSEENIRYILRKHQMTFIKKIVSGSSLFGKARVIKSTLSKYGLNKEDVYYIGDEVRDIDACKQADVKIIAVSWGYNSKKLLKRYNPDYLIDNPKQLLKLLK